MLLRKSGIFSLSFSLVDSEFNKNLSFNYLFRISRVDDHLEVKGFIIYG